MTHGVSVCSYMSYSSCGLNVLNMCSMPHGVTIRKMCHIPPHACVLLVPEASFGLSVLNVCYILHRVSVSKMCVLCLIRSQCFKCVIHEKITTKLSAQKHRPVVSTLTDMKSFSCVSKEFITHPPLFWGGEDYVCEFPLGNSSLVMSIHNPFMYCDVTIRIQIA